MAQTGPLKKNAPCATPNVEYCYRNAYEMSQRRLLNQGIFPVRSRAKEVIVLSVKVLLQSFKATDDTDECPLPNCDRHQKSRL